MNDLDARVARSCPDGSICNLGISQICNLCISPPPSERDRAGRPSESETVDQRFSLSLGDRTAMI